MISIDDPEETVLGYVLFADVAEKKNFSTERSFGFHTTFANH